MSKRAKIATIKVEKKSAGVAYVFGVWVGYGFWSNTHTIYAIYNYNVIISPNNTTHKYRIQFKKGNKFVTLICYF